MYQMLTVRREDLKFIQLKGIIDSILQVIKCTNALFLKTVSEKMFAKKGFQEYYVSQK